MQGRGHEPALTTTWTQDLCAGSFVAVRVLQRECQEFFPLFLGQALKEHLIKGELFECFCVVGRLLCIGLLLWACVGFVLSICFPWILRVGGLKGPSGRDTLACGSYVKGCDLMCYHMHAQLS